PNPNGGSNDRVIRLADVLLMHAEACNQLGDDATAVASLNLVRSRAAVPTLAPGSAAGAALLDAIYHERRVELGLEGHRFFDLVRQGRAADVLEGFIPGKSELFPIPTAEITLSNGALTQNPGYE
ncbi:MAG: RagB/SusD family nutrient uptake outer membrane protein, partial [Flavobacteriales bacterium]